MKDKQQINEQITHDDDPRFKLAVEGTMLAMERTQLAWIRTVMAFMTAGIAIDRGFAALHEARLISGDAWVNNGHLAGLVMTISATLLMAMTNMFYIKRMRELSSMQGEKRKLFDPAFILSFLITLIGILLVYFMLVP